MACATRTVLYYRTGAGAGPEVQACEAPAPGRPLLEESVEGGEGFAVELGTADRIATGERGAGRASWPAGAQAGY